VPARDGDGRWPGLAVQEDTEPRGCIDMDVLSTVRHIEKKSDGRVVFEISGPCQSRRHTKGPRQFLKRAVLRQVRH
jgi:hypothetical protein